MNTLAASLRRCFSPKQNSHTDTDLEIPSKPSKSTRGASNYTLKAFYCLGLVLAFLLYSTLDVNIHRASDSTSQEPPTLVVEVNIKKATPFDSLIAKIREYDSDSANEDLSEENLISDPLTDFVLANFEEDATDPDPTLIDDDDEDTADYVTLHGAEGLPKHDLDGREFTKEEIQDQIDNYKGPIRVALYAGPGTTTNARQNIPPVLNNCSNGTIKVTKFKDASLANIGRRKFDVLFIPGGSGGRMLGEMVTGAKKKHRISPIEKIHKFLKKGGGYVGICAGAFLAAGGKSGRSPLHLSMFKTQYGLLGDGYFSGTTLDESFLNSDMKRFLANGTDDTQLKSSKLFYANGPIFQDKWIKSDNYPERTNPRVIQRVDSDAILRIFYGFHTGRNVHKNVRNNPIVVMNDFGKGKVVLSTAHPETSVHDSTFDVWKKGKSPSECNSQEAKMLMSMVYLAAGRSSTEIQT